MRHTSKNKESMPPESLIDEVLKMDRLLYLEIIRKKKSLTSIQMTLEILALKKDVEPEEVKEREIVRNNPNINKRLRDLNKVGILNDHEGEYSLSSIGFLILDGLAILKSNTEVLRKYKWFFDTHDYTIIPPRQFREIYRLRFARQCKDALEYAKVIEENTAKTTHRICIATERLHDIPSWIIHELKEGHLTLKLIYQFREAFKSNFGDEDELRLWEEIVQKVLPSVEIRYLLLKDRNPISMRIIDRNWANLNLFEIPERNLDRSRSFYGTHVEFITWVEDIFSSMWSFSKELEINNL